jgi:antirestriction protein
MTTLEKLSEDMSISTDAIKSYCDNYGIESKELDTEHFWDSYCGQYEDMEAYAEEMCEQMLNGEAFAWLNNFNYIAYDRIARDLEFEGYWISNEGHIFQPA